jgi:hypothetical protein
MTDIPLRQWTVLAQDPKFLDTAGNALTTTIEVPAERLEPGPKGHRVHVLDYDATADRFYKSRDTDPYKDYYARPSGIDRLLRDPYFHQQNCYAITMGTLYQFEQALGRTVEWGFEQGGHQIKIAPHAFADANAYYSRESESLNFGYFRGTTGKLVYTCLSHDVVVHETTHALLDGLRPHYLIPSSTDQAGFHEGFADVVALLSTFRHPPLVKYALRVLANPAGRIPAGKLSIDAFARTALLKLAEEMGEALEGARGRALRESLTIEPDKGHYRSARFEEEHDRGELLVAIILRAFVKIWVARLAPLLSPRGGGLAINVVAEEGSSAAGQLLHIAIRALDYLPPMDMTYRDYLSGLLTADRELFPDDEKYHYRAALRDEFRAFGVEPASGSKNEGCWDPPPVTDFTLTGLHLERLQRDPQTAFRFVWENRDALGIFPDAFTRVTSVRPVFRVGCDGAVLRETVVEYMQTLNVYSPELASLGIRKPRQMKRSRLITLYGGGSLVFGEFGQLKYHIGTGVRSPKRQGARLQSLWDRGYFADDAPGATARIAQMHRHRELRPVREPREDW